MNRFKPGAIGLALIALATLVLSAGCSSPAATPAPPVANATRPAAPVAPGGTLLGTTQAAGLSLSLFSVPNAPVRGNNQLVVVITDAKGKPVTDARVYLDLDMTNMSHGKYVVPAQPTGQGRYGGRVTFMMPGPWRAITLVERPGQTPVQARFDFRVNLR